MKTLYELYIHYPELIGYYRTAPYSESDYFQSHTNDILFRRVKGTTRMLTYFISESSAYEFYKYLVKERHLKNTDYKVTPVILRY